MSNPILEELFRGMSGNPSAPATTPVKHVIDEAQDFVKRYQEKETFQPGDLVVWKEGMKDRAFPDYNEPIVVLEIFEPERISDQFGNPYDCQPRDMRCLVFKDNEGDLLAFAHDSRRFKKYLPKEDQA